jgi:hypothetical protein
VPISVERQTLTGPYPFLSPELGAPFCVLPLIEESEERTMGRGILLWLLGVPIPVIILLWLFFGR